MTDLLAGQVQLKMDTYATANQLVADGKLRALAYARRARSALMPNVPTVAEMGLAGYEGILWIGMMAPAGTPRQIVDRLAIAAQRATACARSRRAPQARRRRPRGQHARSIRRADHQGNQGVAGFGAVVQDHASIEPAPSRSAQTSESSRCRSSPKDPIPIPRRRGCEAPPGACDSPHPSVRSRRQISVRARQSLYVARCLARNVHRIAGQARSRSRRHRQSRRLWPQLSTACRHARALSRPLPRHRADAGRHKRGRIRPAHAARRAGAAHDEREARPARSELFARDRRARGRARLARAVLSA